MVPALTQYQQDKAIKHLFNDATWTPPTHLYLAAFSTMPTEVGGGTEAAASRLQIDTGMSFGATGSGRYSNSGTLTPTGLPDGTYVGAAVFDASTVGNMLLYAPLTSPKTTTSGSFDIPAGDLIIGFAGATSEYLRDKAVKHLFNDATWTPSSEIYLAAYTVAPTAAGGGTEAVGYTRVRIDNHMTFGATGSGKYINSDLLSFTDLPDAEYVALATFDAATSGNMLTFGTLRFSRTTTDGSLAFPVGNLIVGFN
jgi:hypothetical protein